MRRSTLYFPLVGLLVGLAGAGTHKAVVLFLPHLIALGFVLLFLILLTGALHEDGFADSVDGFGGGWNRAQILEIMRDSRIGSYGSLALVLLVLMKFLLLAHIRPESLNRYLIVAHTLSRWVILPQAFWLPYAREEEGLGKSIAQLISWKELAGATLVALLVLLGVLPAKAVIILAGCGLTTAVSGLYYWRRLRGVTGDCFGATNQLVEVFVYTVGAASSTGRWHEEF